MPYHCGFNTWHVVQMALFTIFPSPVFRQLLRYNYIFSVMTRPHITTNMSGMVCLSQTYFFVSFFCRTQALVNVFSHSTRYCSLSASGSSADWLMMRSSARSARRRRISLVTACADWLKRLRDIVMRQTQRNMSLFGSMIK